MSQLGTIDYFESSDAYVKERRCKSMYLFFKRFLKPIAYITLNVVVTICVICFFKLSGFFGIVSNVTAKAVNETRNQTGNLSMSHFPTEIKPDSISQETMYALFGMDANTLAHSDIIRWKRLEGSDSILQSENDPCVIFKNPGLYSTFSEITFKFNLSQSSWKLPGHSITVKRNEDETLIKKRNFENPRFHKEDRLLLQTTSIHAFICIGQGDKVCVHAAPQDMVYWSELDNSLTFLSVNVLCTHKQNSR
ncbi:uncharacterized protein LOC127874952 [Dreissena polymorpha]|uniref:Uncharacterized protein n=1 Tax=Dreissena polymorpha TaxID=45954 RepID=A0A9D4L245_DREPO|nr:uncharacterized protein LOC127874952 [Dreissena polymorpha]KAH3850090.1 hypothetical protein DPMN_092496 [Dreissena polymorpha]